MVSDHLTESDVPTVVKKMTPEVLYHLCEDHNIYRGGLATMMAVGLVHWVGLFVVGC
jgi:hypothetical protein